MSETGGDISMNEQNNRFDSLSIAFHWIVAIAFWGLFALGAYMVTLGYYDPLYTTLPYWHKGLGIMLIFVVLARLGWRLVSSRPDPLPEHKRYEVIGACFAQWSMNIGLIIVLVSGYLITTSAGAGIDVLGIFTLAAIDTGLNNQEDLAGCLLYTSPSPRDQRGSRMPSSA